MRDLLTLSLINDLTKPRPQISLLLVYLSCPSSEGAEGEGFRTFFCSGVYLCDYPNRRQEEKVSAGKVEEGNGRGGEGTLMTGEEEEKTETRVPTRYLPRTGMCTT